MTVAPGPHALMWSGGKDSLMALNRAVDQGVTIGWLVNFFDAESLRVRFHATRPGMIANQAAALGIPLRQHATTWTDFEAALRGELTALCDLGCTGVVLGDIHLADVRAWYEDRVRAAGLEHVEPIWGERPADLLDEFIAIGGRAVVTCVDLERLDETWIGRVIDETFARDIALTQADPCGENGEYHSFAFAGPGYHQPVRWMAGPLRHAEAGFVQLDVIDSTCAGCGIALDPADYGLCQACDDPTLCAGCAPHHLCTDECTRLGCVPGLCVKMVRDGELASEYGP